MNPVNTWKRFIPLLFKASCSVGRLFNYSNESNYTDKNWINTSGLQLVCCGHHFFFQSCLYYYFARREEKKKKMKNLKVVWIKHGQYLWCLLVVVSRMFDWHYIVNQSIKPWLFTTVHQLNINERASHRTLCGLNILRNCTKLDANGLKEMLHFNKLRILAIYTGW